MHHRHADRSLLPLTCDKGRPAQAGARTNCRQIQQWTENLPERLAEHEAGRGAKLTAAAKDAGITWQVASTERGTRAREHQLKYRGASRRCPVCQAGRGAEPMEAGL